VGLPAVKVTVGGQQLVALLDACSSASFITKGALESIPLERRPQPTSATPIKIHTATSSERETRAVKVELGLGNHLYSLTVYTRDSLPAPQYDMLLGNDFILGRLELFQSTATATILSDRSSVPLFFPRGSSVTVFTATEVTFPPRSEAKVLIRTAIPLDGEDDYYFDPSDMVVHLAGIPGIVKAPVMEVVLRNTSKHALILPVSTAVGTLESVTVGREIKAAAWNTPLLWTEVSAGEAKKVDTLPESLPPPTKRVMAAPGFKIGTHYIGTEATIRAEDLIHKNGDRLTPDDAPLPPIHGHFASITTEPGMKGPETPKARNYAPTEVATVSAMINKLVKDGMLQPSTSTWVSPIVIVKKKDGQLRLCQDYRKLNMITKKDHYPMPVMEDLMVQLSNKKYFTTLDCRSGYWQLKMAPEDVYKTAFITHDGVFEFLRLPFGITNGCAIFQRMMDKVLGPLRGVCCAVYIDDILIYSDTLEEHFQHIQQVFDRLRAANVSLKSSKCKFFMDEVLFLGHTVNAKGISLDLEKIAAILNFPEPKNVNDVLRFLGLCNFYRRFIKDFAYIAEWNEYSEL
jgi:hypothetical protein